MMGKKALLQLFALLFCLSYLPSLGAAPLSKSLALGNQGASVVKVMTMEMAMEDVGFGERRMDLELNDYPGSGANNRHDPRSPGKP